MMIWVRNEISFDMKRILKMFYLKLCYFDYTRFAMSSFLISVIAGMYCKALQSIHLSKKKEKESKKVGKK